MISRSIDLTHGHERNQSPTDGSPSSKIFKKFYMPNSRTNNPTFFKTINPEERYIYKNGKRVECKRIHNFYTSHMFQRGYDKYFRKTIDFSDEDNRRTPAKNTAYSPY